MKGIIAEGVIYAKDYFWVCIKYMHNCHVSGGLQGAIIRWKLFLL